MPEGIRYTAELVAGKVRASVARALMRPGEQVERLQTLDRAHRARGGCHLDQSGFEWVARLSR